MSPEQVRGQRLDDRSDIFSFGAVLYEMASGKRAFRGESSVETMNAILKEDVQEISGTGTQASPGLDRIVPRCLEKNPERRFQSASDLAFALEVLRAPSSSAAQAVSARPPRSLKRWLIGIVVGLIAITAAAGTWMYTRPRSFGGTFRQITFRPAYIRAARFAGGGTVLYGAAIDGQPMEVFSTRTDTFETQPLKVKADVLNVSRTSEMALSVDRDFDIMWVPPGRLARLLLEAARLVA
jgi:serine/threonine protein kinase